MTVLDRLQSALPANAFRDPSAKYLEEPRDRMAGTALAVVAPGSTDEVAAVIRIAAETGTPVIPHGGGTGLVLGQLTDNGAPLILSTERLTAIRDVSAPEDVIVAEAGVTIEAIQNAATEADRLFPLSYASQGTATIGGALAVNSGGINVLRYGNTRDLCLGLEAVLPDGSIWNGLKRLRKDNTGYDLRHLLIGAEGTLGVITAASLRLSPRPANEAALLMTVPDPDTALALLPRARAHLGEAVSAFELIRGTGIDFLEETGTPYRRPFEDTPDWMVLIGIGGPASQDINAGLEELFEEALEAGHTDDGILSQSEADRAALWAMRETIPEANRRIGAIASHDISLPLSAIPDFIKEGEAAMQSFGPLRINVFGHLGDGNLHYNLFPPVGQTREDFDDRKEDMTRTLHDMVHARGGSFSAEHGVGRLKVGDLERYGDPTKLAAMRAIKTALDPKGIMNPGAVLRGSN